MACVRHISLRCVSGRVAVEEEVLSEVDGDTRHRLMCHHTATHLLQSAIKQVEPSNNGGGSRSVVDGCEGFGI